MAVEKNKQFANRFGLNLKIFAYSDSYCDGDFKTPLANPLMVIDFANEVSVEISGDKVWATGGQGHSNKVAFNNPKEGTFTISTQLITPQLIQLASGGDIANFSDEKVLFKNDALGSKANYYVITGDTVWQDEAGNTYSEAITCYKASVKPNYSKTYTGEGDPSSLDIEFELVPNNAGILYGSDFETIGAASNAVHNFVDGKCTICGKEEAQTPATNVVEEYEEEAE